MPLALGSGNKQLSIFRKGLQSRNPQSGVLVSPEIAAYLPSGYTAFLTPINRANYRYLACLGVSWEST